MLPLSDIGAAPSAMAREICESAALSRKFCADAVPSPRLQDVWMSGRRRLWSFVVAEAPATPECSCATSWKHDFICRFQPAPHR